MYKERVGEAAPLVLFLTPICCRDLFTSFLVFLFFSLFFSFSLRSSLQIPILPSMFYLLSNASKARFAFGVFCFSCSFLLPFFVSSVCIDLSSIDNSSYSLHKDRFHLSKTFHYCSIKLHKSLNKNRLITVLLYRFLFKDTPLLVVSFFVHPSMLITLQHEKFS